MKRRRKPGQLPTKIQPSKSTKVPVESPSSDADLHRRLETFNKLLESLPEEDRIFVSQSLSFSGPLPPPAMFSAYEDVLPGGADRIMKMAEKEQNYRIATYPINKKRGQWLGATAVLAGISAAVLLGIFGNNSYLAGGSLMLPVVLQIIHRIWRTMTD